MHRRFVSGIVFSCMCAAGMAFAAPEATQPAVSGPNLSVSAEAGAVDGEAAAFGNASASFPIGHRYGVQIDGVYGDGNHSSSGIGAHFFYRNPASYLLGVTAMTSEYGDARITRYGVESEFYLDDFTVAPAFGLQDGDRGLDNTGFYTVDGSYYADDNLKFTLGSTGFSDVRAVYGVTEWQPQDERPMTVYGTLGAANEGEAFATAGVRYTFGAPDSTIKRRDRTGDPSNIVKTAITYVSSAFDQVYSSGGFGNKFK